MRSQPGPGQGSRRRLTIIGCFGAIYVVWGSTYLAIRIALETLPPFLLAGGRFLGAGLLLYWWLRLRGVARPTPGQWWAALITGTLMLVGGAGGVRDSENINRPKIAFRFR